MMNQKQAIAYGKSHDVKYYVKIAKTVPNGETETYLNGGTRTYEQAVEIKSELEARMANDPLAQRELKVFIVEA